MMASPTTRRTTCAALFGWRLTRLLQQPIGFLRKSLFVGANWASELETWCHAYGKDILIY